MAGKTIGQQIKASRARLGLSQSQAARRWKISIRTLQQWEQGHRIPRVPALRYIEEVILRDLGQKP